MRIVFLSYHYSPDVRTPQEWIERIKYYTGWAECLAKNHSIIRIDQIDFTGDFSHHDIRYYCVNDGKRKNYFPLKLNRFVKKLNPDIVIISSFQYPLQLIQLRLVLGKQIKIVLQHHAEKPFTGMKKWIQNFASRKADAFLFTSYETGAAWVRDKNLHSYKKIFELQEVSSSFQSIDREAARKTTHASGSRLYLWVGRLDQNKDPLTVVRAFLKFAGLHRDVKLYMIYQSDELLTEIKELLPPNPDTGPVLLLGKIPHGDLLYWYNSADFYISASHYEGSGTALCEAMSCGCTPLLSNIPPFRKIAGSNGLFFEPGNERELISVLVETSRLNLAEERIRVLDHFKKDLSFPAIAEKFEQIAGSI